MIQSILVYAFKNIEKGSISFIHQRTRESMVQKRLRIPIIGQMIILKRLQLTIKCRSINQLFKK